MSTLRIAVIVRRHRRRGASRRQIELCGSPLRSGRGGRGGRVGRCCARASNFLRSLFSVQKRASGSDVAAVPAVNLTRTLIE